MHLSLFHLPTAKPILMTCTQIFFLHFIISPNDVTFSYYSSNPTTMLLIMFGSPHINQCLNITFLHSFKSRILNSLAYLLNLTHLNICWAQEDAFSLRAFNHDFLLTYNVLSHHCFYISKSYLSLEAQVKSSAWHASSINGLAGSYFNFWNPIRYSLTSGRS